jgi:hypothetical protein
MNTKVTYTQEGNKCSRGFKVTLRNKNDLYNFYDMNLEALLSTTAEECETQCSEIDGCAFYEFTEQYGEEPSECLYVRDWTAGVAEQGETVKGQQVAGMVKTSYCYIRNQ